MADESDAASVVTSELATSAQRRTAAASMPSVRRYVGALVVFAGLLIIFATSTAAHSTRLDWALWLPVLFASFAVVEYAALQVEVRTGTMALPLTEIPLAAALLLVPFPIAISAAVAAVALRALSLRQHLVTLSYNISAAASEVALAYLIVTQLQKAGVPELGTLLVGLVSSSLYGNFNSVGLTWAMGGPRRGLISGHLATTSMTMTVVSPLVVILGVQLLRSGPTGWALLTGVLVVFAVLYRSYSVLLRERHDLDLVQKISQAVSSHEGAWNEVLELIRAQFNAGRAVLRLPDVAEVVLSGVWEQGDEAIYKSIDAVGLLAQSHAQLLTARSSSEPVVRALRRRHLTEALVAPLGSGGRAGYIELHDRQNPVRGFSVHDVALLATLATHVATAIDNSRMMYELSHAAYHDQLTGLMNRVGFTQEIASTLEADRSNDGSQMRAVILVSLGALGQVNDALGLRWGDRLVIYSSQRVVKASVTVLGDKSAVCRIDGDTFALLTDVVDADECEVLAEMLARNLESPYQLEEFAVEASVSIGISYVVVENSVETAGVDIDQLLQHADVAMQAARAAGESVRTYHDGMGQRFLRRFQLVTQFRAAMASGDVHVHEQPKLGLANRKVVGAEALLRWRHPVFGDVDPEELVQVLEATGLMMDLTSFVLDRSLARARHHLDQGLRIDPAVNVSVRNLLAPSFPAMVTDALERHQVPAAMLTLEITETSVMGDAERTLPALRVLHELGISLSVDDFGTGYSSLSYLRRLPVDEIKIDKSFVLGMGADLSDHAVVRSIIDLGHSLDLRVVAEGVETDVVREQLADMGCDVIQGYLVSRALEPTRFDSWLHARTYREGGGLEGPAVAPTLARPSSR